MNEIDLSQADLNLLVVFEAVLHERHVGRAADRLNVTSSAVSHGLKRLRTLLDDPLFLRTPKGVVPTTRATEIAGPIAEILARVRSVLSTAKPFDPTTSNRHFTIGAPDGVSAVVLGALLEDLMHSAPGIDIGIRQLLPIPAEQDPERAWQLAFSELETRALDVAIVPSPSVPARFVDRVLYDEDFVIAMRAGHPLAADPTLERYCRAQHLVVGSNTQGFVDEALAKRGRSRRIALTIPNFSFALAVVSDTDLVAALPRRFVATQASRLGVVFREAPLPLRRFRVRAVVPKAAMLDAGLAWLFETIVRAARRGEDRAAAPTAAPGPRTPAHPSKRRRR